MQKNLSSLLEKRKEREALALRTNLLKRKQQLKARCVKPLSFSSKQEG